MFVCCCCTVDNSARVKAAVLLAPVGSDAGAFWEVAHRGRLHVNDLHIQNEELTLNRPHTHISTEMPVNVENPYVIWFTHSLLQQLLQAVDVWSVPSLPLHHHAVSAGRKCGYRQQPVSLARHKE